MRPTLRVVAHTGCAFCDNAGANQSATTASTSPATPGECVGWCSEQFASTHCTHDACAACAYCGTSASAAALRAAEEGAAGRGAGSGTALGSSGSSGPPATQPGGELLSGEETAFWTFVAWVELLLPSDFYAPPDMIGLQR